MSARLRAQHRRLAPLAALVVLGWGLSGLLHPLMRLTAPALSTTRAPAHETHAADVKLDLRAALAQRGVNAVRALGLVRVEERDFARIEPDGATPALYLDIASGDELANGEALHAEALARHFAGDLNSPVRAVTRIDAYDLEYTSINRLLPVFRVDFERDDALRVYVDPASERLGAAVDRRRGTLLRAFGLVHTGGFLPFGATVRVLVISGLMLVVALTAISGLRLARASRGALGLRRAHRLLGRGFAATLLSFPLSGLYHATAKLGAAPEALTRATTAIPVVYLALPLVRALERTTELGPACSLALALLGGRPALRIAHPAALSWLDAETGELFLDGEDLRARELAAHFSERPLESIESVALVASFSDEYGFIRKRLPVQRVEFRDRRAPVVFVETSTGILAESLTRSGRLELWSFDRIHKWSFANPLGPNGRDALVALAILGNLSLAALGLALWFRRECRREAGPAPRARRRSPRS